MIDNRPIILDARCDRCSRFVKVVGVWREGPADHPEGVVAIDVICAKHGRRERIAKGFAVFWTGDIE